MEPKIRRARPDDARPIAEIHIESWQGAYSNILSPEIISRHPLEEREATWEKILSKSEDDAARTFVLELNGEIVGFSLTLAGRDDDLDPKSTAELAGLYFLQSHWRRGLGTKLQRRALDELREQGFHDVVLWVLEDNHGACAFYEATGWQFDKRDPSYRDFNAACRRYRLAL